MKKTIFVIWRVLKIINWSQFYPVVVLVLECNLWNSDGQQFHWHQQSEQLRVTLAHWTLKKTTSCQRDVGNSSPGHGIGQAQKLG